MPRKSQFPPPVRTVTIKGVVYARCYVDGKYVHLGVDGSPEAHAAYTELIARLSAKMKEPKNVPITAATATVATVCAAWLKAHEKTAAKKEIDAYQRAIKVLVRCTDSGRTPAAAFGVVDLERVRMAMLTGSWMNDVEKASYKERGIPLDWSRGVTTRQVIRVRTIWRWAGRTGLAPAGTFAALQDLPPLHPRAGRQTDPRRPVDLADVEKVAQYAADPVAAMMKLSWWSGMRPGEVRIMRTCDVDRETGPLVDGVRIWLYRPSQHKNKWRGMERIVPLGVECQRLLAPWLRPDAPEAWVFQPPRRRHPRCLPYYTEYSYCQAVRRAAKTAGVALTPYCLRHSMKNRITREMGLDAARAILGQESIATTDGYAKGTDLEFAARVARRMG